MTMKPRFEWRHQYDNDRDRKEGDNAILACEDPSLTVQSFVEDADLNILAKRFGITNIPLAPISTDEPYDNTALPELRDVLEARRDAANKFMELPLKLRKRFHNRPDELWEFINDPENAQEAIRLGIITTKIIDERPIELIPKEPKKAPPAPPKDPPATPEGSK